MEVKEAAVAYGNRHFSIEEYLAIENEAIEKSEYYMGEVFAMSGAKGQHNIITSNLHYQLRKKLQGSSCRPFGSDLRIHIPSNTLFTYPDLSVICGDMISMNDDDMNFLNPSVIFEVLSPSTRGYDRIGKFELYRDIATLREYIMVDTARAYIESWHINENGKWELNDYKKITDSLVLPTLGIAVRLKDVYEGTKVMKLTNDSEQ